MVEGEKTRFWIPGDLAYGDKPTAGAPAGTLVFDVELLAIESREATNRQEAARTTASATAPAATGWLRAAVLGANDGIVSTASLVRRRRGRGGDARSDPGRRRCRAGAGAMSMAAGEYVSVQLPGRHRAGRSRRASARSSHATRVEHARACRPSTWPRSRAALARQVADQLMAHDALGAHARDELGISEMLSARPIQAALASAATFAVGAALPLLSPARRPPAGIRRWAALLAPCEPWRPGGPRRWRAARRGAIRVTFWGALAMGVTDLVGRLFGAHAI